jgi:CubicO group peptidase (beta-lactamase class C family)
MKKPVLLLLLAACLFAAVSQAAPVPPALQEVRRHIVDASVNVLTFHSMDQIFDTRRVDNAGPVWNLPAAPHALDFTYVHGGKTYGAEEALERTFTNALVIVKHGKVVAEIYRNKTDAGSHFISFSMAKSITSILIGIAISEGRIHSVDDMIVRYVPELKGSAYDGVTIRQALEMRSGVDFDERYDFSHPSLATAAFEESFVQGRVRFASFGLLLPRAYPPGTHWNYSTIEACILGWVLERATGVHIADYTAEKLWKPLGAESYGFWVLDGSPDVGREINGAGFNAVARDYARIGLLMLHEGKAQTKQIVPASWVKESTAPRETPPVAPGASLGYRYQWWTVPGTDAYLAIGLQGQFIYVDPATDSVVVKLSYFPPDNEGVENEALEFLMAAAAWNPQ